MRVQLICKVSIKQTLRHKHSYTSRTKMMKFSLFCVFTLWACLGQICAGNDETFNVIEVEKIIRQIYGVGDQFVDDFMKLWEKYQKNYYVLEFVGSIIELVNKEIPKEKNSKIDVNQVVKNRSRFQGHRAILIEELKLWQSILSKQLPPERYNGVINLVFAFVIDYATTEEIQSALNYLNGVDVEATKTSFLDAHNIPNPTISGENDCSDQHQRLSSTIDELSRFVGMKPKVMQDFLTIRETFPCNEFVHRSLRHFVHIIKALSGDKAKITACMIKESPGNWDDSTRSKAYLEQVLEGSESVLSARLPDETIRGIINFKRATIPDTPIDDIEKALEYLYDDVPKADCPTASESSTDTK